MINELENGGISRRNFLKKSGATAGLVVAGSLVGGQALAQGKDRGYPPGYDNMIRAQREFMAADEKAKDLRNAKPYRDALDAQKKIFKQGGNNNPRQTEYEDALAITFGITDWTTDEGRKIIRYLNDWYNEN